MTIGEVIDYLKSTAPSTDWLPSSDPAFKVGGRWGSGRPSESIKGSK